MKFVITPKLPCQKYYFLSVGSLSYDLSEMLLLSVSPPSFINSLTHAKNLLLSLLICELINNAYYVKVLHQF